MFKGQCEKFRDIRRLRKVVLEKRDFKFCCKFTSV